MSRPGGSIKYLARTTPPAFAAWRSAIQDAAGAWDQVDMIAMEYERASVPTYVYWRKDPEVSTPRILSAAAVAERLSNAVDLANGYERQAEELRLIWFAEMQLGG